MKAVCFVLLNVLVRVIDGVQPKTVNLALETVLQFDKKNYDGDVNVINKVQKFLDTVKKHVVKNGRRRSSNDLKLTDFIKESAKILKECKDSDLEDVFAVLDDEIRKYHYKGCKFYELVEDIDVRRFMTTQLAQAKGANADELRKGLEKVVITIENDTLNGKEKSLLQIMESLYTGTDRVFRSVLNGLEKYKVKGAEGMNLPQFLSSSLRTLLFDHYSNLNSNARENIRSVINSYLKPTNTKVLYNSRSRNGNKKPGLRINLDGFANKAMNAWSRYVLRNTKPTHRPVLRDIADDVFEDMEAKQKRYKITDATEATEAPTTTEVTTTESTTTPTTTSSPRSTKLSFDDEDYTASESEETVSVQPKGKGNKHVLRMKSTTPDEDELFLNPREFTMLSPERDYSVRPVKKNKKIKAKVADVNENEKDSLAIEIVGNNAQGAASIEIISSETTTDANRLEIIEREFDDGKDNTVKVKGKKEPYPESQVTNYYGEVVNSNGGFLTDEEAGLKQDPLSLEHLSIETKARESVEVDTGSARLLVGGQDIKTMLYRSDLVTKKVNILDNKKKNEKLKNINSHIRNKDKNDGKMKPAEGHEHKHNIKHKEKKDKVTKKKSHHNRQKEKKNDDSIDVESFVKNVMKTGVETIGYKVRNPEKRKKSVRHKGKKHENTVEIEAVGSVVHKPKKDIKREKVEVIKSVQSGETKHNVPDKETKPEDPMEIKFVESSGHKPKKDVAFKSVSHKPKSEEAQDISPRHKAKKHKKLVDIDNVGSVDHKPKKHVKSEELGIIKSKEVNKPSHQHKIKKPKYSEIDDIRSVDHQPKKHAKLKDIKVMKPEEAVDIKPNLRYKVKKHRDSIEIDDIKNVDHPSKKHLKSKDMKVIKSEEAPEIKPNILYKVKKHKDLIDVDDIRSVDDQPKKHVKSKDMKVIKSEEALEIKPNILYKVKKHKNLIEIDNIRSVDHQPKKHVKSKDMKVLQSEEAVEIKPNLRHKEKEHKQPVEIEFVEKFEVIKSDEPKQINPRHKAKKHKTLVDIDNVGSVDHKPKNNNPVEIEFEEDMKVIKSEEAVEIKPNLRHKEKKHKQPLEIEFVEKIEVIKAEEPKQITPRHKVNKHKKLVQIDNVGSVDHKPKKSVKSEELEIIKSKENIKPSHSKIEKPKNSIEIDDIKSVNHKPKKHAKPKVIKVIKSEEAVEIIKPSLRYDVKKHKNSIEIGDIRSLEHVGSEDVKAKSEGSEEIRSKHWYKFEENKDPVLKAHEKTKNIEPNKDDTSDHIEEILAEHNAVIKVEAQRGLRESATSEQTIIQEPINHDEAKHIHKHKKTSHKQKTHISSPKDKVDARRALNNIKSHKTLGDILKSNLIAPTDKKGLKIKEPFGMLESQQMRTRLDEKEALLNKTRQEKKSLPSSIASLIPTKQRKDTQEVTYPHIVEKMVTPTEYNLLQTTPWTTVSTISTPLFRSQDNPDISSNVFNKETFRDATTPSIQSDVGKIIDNINMISKENINTGDTLDSLLKLKDMIATHPELKEKWNSIQALNNVESKTQETSSYKSITGESSQQKLPKDTSQLKDSLLSMMHTNVNKLVNVTSGTTKVEMAVTAQPVTLGEDMKRQWDTLKKEWESLKTNKALKDPITTKVTLKSTT